jgi:flagellin
MSSLLTNNSALVALQTLRSINASLDQANNRVSTGLRVNSAADNAAYWSIATTIRSDNGALSAVQDALGLGKSTVDTVSTGLDAVQTSLQKIKEKLVSASSPNVDRSKLQTEISDLISQLRSNADNTVAVGGDNWLAVDSSKASYNADKTVVAAFSRTATGVEVNSISIDTSTVKLYDDNATVHASVDAAVTTAASTYATAKTAADTAYGTAATAADTAYNTAIAAADTAFAPGGSDVGDVAVRDAAYAAALVTKNTAYTTAATTKTTAYAGAATAFDNSLNASGTNSLGILDKTRVATASNGQADASSVADIDISSLTGSAADLATISNYLNIVDSALTDLTNASTTMGSVSSRIGSQSTFVKALIDANTSAVGTLVDANMEEESTKLKALQTQQQLAVQSLSIANSSSQNILLLFRN